MGKKFQACAMSMVLLAGLPAACGVIDQNDAERAASAGTINFDERDHGLIAENFVDTLAQLAGLSPIPTTIQMMASTTPFGKSLEHHIIEKGYGHQLVNGDMGNYFLRYRVEKAETHTGYTRIFQVSIGDIVLEREFQRIDSHVTPISAMRIAGADATRIKLNDDIFRFNNPNEFESTIETVQGQNPDSLQLADKARLPVPSSSNAISLGNSNVFEKRRSNYEALFRQYRDVQDVLLPFANNSIKLSFVNWEKMEQLLGQYEAVTDIFSVVGCSLGKTNNEQSNAELAVSRTDRVKEALIRSDVSPENIYAESCWGKDYLDGQLPRRGVILTLKRRVQ